MLRERESNTRSDATRVPWKESPGREANADGLRQEIRMGEPVWVEALGSGGDWGEMGNVCSASRYEY